jgi:solute carrier family 35, member F3/4
MYFGVCVTIFITFCWVGSTHCFYFLFLPSTKLHHSLSSSMKGNNEISNNNIDNTSHLDQGRISSQSVFKAITMPLNQPSSSTISVTTSKVKKPEDLQFKAPFFASWFSTNFAILFFPLFLIFRGCASKCGTNNETIGDIFQCFRERGYTLGRYLYRCITFTILWVCTTFLYLYSLKILHSTDVITLFSTNVAPAYLLSWVILHEQFVGVRVSVLSFF